MNVVPTSGKVPLNNLIVIIKGAAERMGRAHQLWRSQEVFWDGFPRRDSSHLL